MKKIISSVLLALVGYFASAQNSNLVSYGEEVFYDSQARLNYIRFKENYRVGQEEVPEFINLMIFNSGKNYVSVQKTETDELGFTHTRFGVYQNGITVFNKTIIAHCKNGKLISLNGDLYDQSMTQNDYALSESSALGFALAKVNAKKYKWENREEEQHMRVALNDPSFSYYPVAKKIVYEKEGKNYGAYVFNIYAEEPLYRANVVVNAATGVILDEQNLICTADVPGTALTKFSGSQSFTCDQNGATYRLRETQRGLGIETYNLNYGSTYTNTDFTNTATSWTSTGPDQGATDAHWGAEKTYDYYWTQHNRNSINNAGFKLVSYVHYTTNYANAFWDGQRMTYGDGTGNGTQIFTALDVCGHEISHGLTGNTAGLVYSNESGALNESFSDIFGTCIENYARPGNWNWKIGEDVTTNGSGLRTMANPNSFGDPDTYGGTNWYTGTADNGGVHTNSGVSNYWFYLLTMGGSGTNDLSNPYNVTGLGFTNAGKIAFRALTVYFTSNTNYASARNLCIQAAKDLFGSCSNEMIQTTNAWYAVGVGAQYSPTTLNTNFTGNITNFCTLPASVSFNNTTPNGLTYMWDFGDGTTSTATNVIHTYTSNGTYNVKLKAFGCNNVTDSITKTSYILINVPPTPVATGASGCANSPMVLTATGGSNLKWFSNMSAAIELGAGNSFTTPSTPANATYYVASTVSNAPVFGGMPSNTGGSFLNNANQWLVFDVTQTATLNSVVVYAQAAGNRVIQLRNNIGTPLNTVTVTLAAGANTVTLNFPLPIGNSLRLGLGANSTSNLYRSNSGVSYPYNIGGCVSIIGSSAGSTLYYWFYNWKVTKSDCMSPLVAVTASVLPTTQVSIVGPQSVCKDDEIVLDGTPAGGTFSGPGMNGTVFNAASIGSGSFTVSYSYIDGNGCDNKANSVLRVEDCTGLSSLSSKDVVFVYPNPVKDVLYVNTNIGIAAKVMVSDASGRLLMEQKMNGNTGTINMESFSKGIYFFSVVNDQSGKVIQVSKVIKD
jgi:Zn-dependent metalloprotease